MDDDARRDLDPPDDLILALREHGIRDQAFEALPDAALVVDRDGIVSDLNRLYVNEPSLHELDCDPAGFEWVDASDTDSSVYSFLRRGKTTGDVMLVVINATPVVRANYRIGVPRGGWWREMLNSDAGEYWGGGIGNSGGMMADPEPVHGRDHSLNLTLPPLGALFFKSEG